MFVGIEFLLAISSVVVFLLVYRKLVKSRTFDRAVRDLTTLPPDEEAALRAVDDALEMAEEVGDDLEEAQCRRDVMLKELRRKTRM